MSTDQCRFSSSELINFDFIKCELKDVEFSGSTLDNVKSKGSNLETINVWGVHAYNNDRLIVPIKDYESFLKKLVN